MISFLSSLKNSFGNYFNDKNKISNKTKSNISFKELQNTEECAASRIDTSRTFTPRKSKDSFFSNLFKSIFGNKKETKTQPANSNPNEITYNDINKIPIPRDLKKL